MKEEDIRPTELMMENQKLRQEDAQDLIKNKHDFVNILCPACESNNYQRKFQKEGFDFVACNICQTLFVNPRPSFNLLNKFYESSKCLKHWNKFFASTEDSRRQNIFVPRAEQVIKLCKKHNIKTKTLLDVGAGFGTFCEEIEKHNFFNKVIAVEPSIDLAETCKKKGLTVIDKPIEKISLDGVDVITNFELIEHLFCPKDFVKSCYDALSSEGLLILTTPNIKGFDLITLGKISTNIAGPNHLNYFHPESLTLLLESSGFKVMDVLTPGKLDAELVRKKIINKELDVTNNPFLQLILIDKWDEVGQNFQNFLSTNKLSSHMWIVAKKN